MIKSLGRFDPIGMLVLSAICLASSACANDAASAGSKTPVSVAVDPDAAMTSERARTRFAVETALGATCHRESGSASTWHFDRFRARVSCHGTPPAHVIDAIVGLPDTHRLLTPAMRERIRSGAFDYLAVPGLGRRADFIVLLDDAEGLWLRTFEGLDPGVTVYMVFGPSSEGESSLRNFRLYRSTAGGVPEDVTDRLAPAKPALTPEESVRYDRLVDPEVEGLRATDDDIAIDPALSIHRPMMRWTLEQTEAGLDLLSESEPRFDGERLHFGFLVWNGRRFELHERMPYTQVACLEERFVSAQEEAMRSCDAGSVRNSNRFLDDDRS